MSSVILEMFNTCWEISFWQKAQKNGFKFLTQDKHESHFVSKCLKLHEVSAKIRPEVVINGYAMGWKCTTKPLFSSFDAPRLKHWKLSVNDGFDSCAIVSVFANFDQRILQDVCGKGWIGGILEGRWNFTRSNDEKWTSAQELIIYSLSHPLAGAECSLHKHTLEYSQILPSSPVGVLHPYKCSTEFSGWRPKVFSLV